MRRRSRGKDKGGGGKVLGWKGEVEEKRGRRRSQWIEDGGESGGAKVRGGGGAGEWRSKKKGTGWWRHRCIISSLTLLLNILPV